MKQRFFLLLCFIASFLSAAAEGYTADNIPMPYLQDARRHTVNPDGILSAETVAQLDSILFRLEQTKGVQAQVIVVKRVEGGDCYEFGMDVARKYRLGSKKQDSGLLFILATEDRGYYILTGEGLEGTLPDAICKRIENNYMIPYLKEGDWNKAMTESVKAADGYLQGDMSLQAEEDEEDEAAMIALLIVVVGVTISVAVATIAQRRKTKCPKCGKHTLQKTASVVLSKKKGVVTRQVTYVCSECGHTLQRTEKEQDEDYIGHGPIFIGGGGRSGFGGGFGGGSFGGGSFGGGGAGGRF